MADRVIENLITKFTFDVDKKTLEGFNKAVDDAEKLLLGVVTAATAAATAIFVFTKKMAEANDELGKFAQLIGVDVEALQELGFVAEIDGAAIDSMGNSLKELTARSSEAARGIGAGVEAFGLLGISVTDSMGKIKDADDLFLDVSDSISRLDTQAQKLELMRKLGISDDLLLTLDKGRASIERLRQEARDLDFIIGKDAADSAAKFNDAMIKVQRIVRGVSSFIATKAMKRITPFIDMFVSWWKINKKLVKQNVTVFFEKAITVIKGVFNAIVRVVNIISSLVNIMGGWKNSIIAVSALLLAMNASALLMPILVIAAGAGILLILEDLIKFAEGGDSALGNLAERFPAFDVLLRGTLKLLTMIKDGWVLLFTEGDTAFEGMMLMISDLRKEFPILNTLLKGTSDLISKIVDGWVLLFTEGDKAFEGMMLMIRDAGEAITNFFIEPLNKAIELLNKIPGVDIKKQTSEDFSISDLSPIVLFGKAFSKIIEGMNEIPGIDFKKVEPMSVGDSQVQNAAPMSVGDSQVQNVAPIIESVLRTQKIKTLAPISGGIPGGPGSNTTNNNTNKPTINININGGDTEKVKRVVNDVLTEQYSGAESNLQSQVDF